MTLYVTAEDLMLSIRTDGRMYDRCVIAARITAPAARRAAFNSLISAGWTNYKRDVGPALVESASLAEASRLLEADMLAHVADMAAHEARVAALPPIGYTYRTACGRGRITYRPDWSKSQPWVSYIGGTAGLHFASVAEAVSYFAKKNMTLNTEVSK